VINNQDTTINGVPPGAPGEYADDLHQHNISWWGGADWKPTPDLLFYANVAKGYDLENAVLDSTTLLQSCNSSKSPSLKSITTTLLSAAKPYLAPSRQAALYEFRTYALYPGFVQEYMDLLLAVQPVREKYSANVCIWRPVVGNVDQIMHLWSYQTMEERDSFRHVLHEEPDWN
jgi:hypothetical protein